MQDPNPDDPLNKEAAEAFVKEPATFARQVRRPPLTVMYCDLMFCISCNNEMCSCVPYPTDPLPQAAPTGPNSSGCDSIPPVG